MSKRRPRTTRTITFRGGPDDGIVGQHPLGYDEIRANTVFDNHGRAIGWDEYRGPGGAGAATFDYVKHVGAEAPAAGGEVHGPAIGNGHVYVAPPGSAGDTTQWVDITDAIAPGSAHLAAEPHSSFTGVGEVVDVGERVAAMCDRCHQPTSAIAAIGRPHITCGGTFRARSSEGMAVRVAQAAAREPRPHA